MSMIVDKYSLYFDAVNEKGLGIGGLNFDGFAVYHDEKKDKKNHQSITLIKTHKKESKQLEPFSVALIPFLLCL